MREGFRCAVSGVVHDQCPLLHLLFDETRYVRIAVARRRADTVVSIPHNALHHHIGVAVFYQSAYRVGVSHVDVIVAVVAHHAERVLPGASLFVAGVADYFVNDNGRIVGVAGRYASYGSVGLVFAYHVAALTVVQHAEVVVAHVAVRLAIRVLALVAEQEIVRREVLPR